MSFSTYYLFAGKEKVIAFSRLSTAKILDLPLCVNCVLLPFKFAAFCMARQKPNSVDISLRYISWPRKTTNEHSYLGFHPKLQIRNMLSAKKKTEVITD